MAVITSRTGARSWATATDWVGDACPVDNVDSAVIAPDCQMLMNQDQSAWTGLLGVTISGHATTPGMLYWKDGTDGYLRLKTGFNIIGTTGTEKGRLLANSNGTWGATGALTFANKAVILLGATSSIVATYLDIRLYGYNAMAHKYLRTYGVRHTVTADATANTLTKNSHGLANTTPVMIMSDTTIPAPLAADTVYYVVSTATNTFQLASVSGGTAIDLTDAGSGTVEVYTGAGATLGDAGNPLPVFEDVTAETGWVASADGWTTATGHNKVVEVNAGPQNYDQKRLALVTISADHVHLSAAVGTQQYPGARIYLSSRNVSIRSACVTGVNIVDYSSATSAAGVFQCELVSTAGIGVSNTTFYGYGVYSGTGHTISGTVTGCSYGVIYGTGHTISGRIGYTAAGVRAANTYDFRFGVEDSSGLKVVCRGAKFLGGSTMFHTSRNTAGVGSQGQAVYCEDYGADGAPVLGASWAFHPTGDVIKNTTTVRSGGAASSLEVVPLSNCSLYAPILVCEWTELAVPASAQNKSVYVKGEGWTFGPGNAPLASELYFEAEYISNGTTFARTTVASTQVLTDNTTWVQLATGSFTPAAAGHVRYRVWLKKYAASCKVYVDNALYSA